MARMLAGVPLFCATILLAPPAFAITMDWSYVGSPGNAADPLTGYGAVNYAYYIGTYDVTVSQYVAFLNSNDPTGANLLALYNTGMSNEMYGGVVFNSSASDGSMYSVKAGDGDHPMNYVNWFDAIRFANWMDNGQVPGTTETGAYTLLGGTPIPSNADSITRNPGSTVFLPTADEWYKAAYYNGATNSFFFYPTSSNVVPNPSYPTPVPNSANFGSVVDPSSSVDDLTNVGAYSGTTSPSGAFDMGGDVWNWDENLYNLGVDGFARGISGSGFADSYQFLESPYSEYNAYPSRYPVPEGDYQGGFRLASVPEPGTALLAVLACGAALLWRKRLGPAFGASR